MILKRSIQLAKLVMEKLNNVGKRKNFENSKKRTELLLSSTFGIRQKYYDDRNQIASTSFVFLEYEAVGEDPWPKIPLQRSKKSLTSRY